MAKRSTSPDAKLIEQYTHTDKKCHTNPQVGLVTPETDKDGGKQTYSYDPHLDPQLQWAGKAEHTSFEVPAVSLHVHERIDPRTIIEAVRRKHETEANYQPSLFFGVESNLPLFQEIEFYKHRHNWANRLIAGDSTLVMNSLIVKEGMAGAVQMVYFDPPYGIKYGSNFQPFVNKRDVKDGKDDDLTSEPETLKAFRDTWELGIHSYLTYLRDRLLLARELLHEAGSIFVQISDENMHLVRNLMDEVFGVENYCQTIPFRKKLMPLGAKLLEGMNDYLIWYAKDIDSVQKKFKHLYRKTLPKATSRWTNVELSDGTRRKLTAQETEVIDSLPSDWRIYRLVSQRAPSFSAANVYDFEFQGRTFRPPEKGCWVTTKEKMQKLADSKRLEAEGDNLSYIYYHDDFPYSKINNQWTDTSPVQNKSYVVQTTELAVERCMLMTTDPSDLVLDITCGSGTTAFVAEQWGRRWITCDTSRVALTLAKQRLMTATFNYYRLAKPEEGIASGFKYKTVPHVTLKSIANNEPSATETLYDQPLIERNTARVTSPFTVEAVPAPVVQMLSMSEPEAVATGSDSASAEKKPFAIAPGSDFVADNSIARSGESLRQNEWRGELLRTGIRGCRGEKMLFSRVEPLAGTRHLHADAEVMNEDGTETARAVVSFAPEHQPLPPAQVESALLEANKLFPKPKFVIFAAFQFDPVAVNNIEQTNWQGVTLLKAQMNADLQTADLKKNRSTNESFWLIGQPDVQIRKVGTVGTGSGSDRLANVKKPVAAAPGSDGTLYQVEVLGFDYYNVKEGAIESGSTNRIAVWMLDTNFDGRSLFPHQVFFPLSGAKEGWTRLASNLKAGIDQELIESYHGSVSLPFTIGDRKRVAVKIVDDRGIESLKLIDV